MISFSLPCGLEAVVIPSRSVTRHHPDFMVICPPFQGKRGHFPRGPVLGNAGFAGVTRPRILRWGRSGFPGPGPVTGDCAGGRGGPGVRVRLTFSCSGPHVRAALSRPPWGAGPGHGPRFREARSAEGAGRRGTHRRELSPEPGRRGPRPSALLSVGRSFLILRLETGPGFGFLVPATTRLVLQAAGRRG